jgi:HlyD family secretion protein
MTWRTPVTLVGAGMAALTLHACGQKPAPAGEAPPQPADSDAIAMRVSLADMRRVSDTVAATGRLVVREEVAVGSELAGFPVEAVLVDEGAWVTAGEPLARLDDSLLAAQIRQQEAVVAQLEATAAFRESQAERVKGLENTGALSVEAIDQRVMEAVSARAAVRSAQAGLDELRTRQSRMVLRAPAAGRVLERNVRPGDISGMGGAPYFRIARGGLVELDAELPADVLGQIDDGERALVSLPSGESFEGSVRFISPRVDERTGLGRARIALPYDEALRAGAFANAEFSDVERETLTAPASSVRYESGGPALMVVDADNRVRRAPVKLGQRLGDWVEIAGGVEPGSRVLSTGAAFVLDGDVIRPVEEDAPASAPAPAPVAAAPQESAAR